MATHPTDSIEAQVHALVDIFVAGITPREAGGILEEGPTALLRACFQWAFQAAGEVEEAAPLDPTKRASLLERAPLVNRLRNEAVKRFVETFGEPRRPRLPERAEGLHSGVCINLDAEDHRRMSRSARSLCHTVVYSVCMSWQSWFFITRNRDRSQFILWNQWEDGESYRTFTTPAAWLPARKGLSERDAALLLLEDYWAAMLREWDHGRPNELNVRGSTVTQDELELLAERVWPED